MGHPSKRQKQRKRARRQARERSGNTATPGVNQGSKPTMSQKSGANDKQNKESAKDQTPAPVRPPVKANHKNHDNPQAAQEYPDTASDKKTIPLGLKSTVRRRHRCYSTWFMVIFTAVIAGANIIYACYGYRQLKMMSSQLGLMGQQLSEMRAASQSDSAAWSRQLGIMDGQLSQMRQNASLENRAWVGIANATHQPIEPNKPAEGAFIFVNTGKTPASIIAMGHTVCIRPFDFDVENAASTAEKTAWTTEIPIQSCLAPNASMALNFSTPKDKPLPDDVVASIKSGKKRLYVIGRIVYCDTFGEEHQTKFCGIAQPDTQKMSMHHRYNYMD